jgi:hypothetical protein
MEEETADDNDIEEDMEMLFTTMSAENADELFNSQRNKIFYLYKGNKDERINVTQLIMMMQQNGLNLRPIIVDIQEPSSLQAFKQVYKDRFPDKEAEFDKFIE